MTAVAERVRAFVRRFDGEIGAVGVFLASRAAALIAYSTAAYIAHRPVVLVAGGWDGQWYTSIVLDGYAGSGPGFLRLAFFPALPRVLDVLHRLFDIHPSTAGMIASPVFGCVFVVLLWRLAAELTNRPVANRTVALVSFFPAALVFSIPYSEPLMLALAAACLLALLHRRWWWAGVSAGLATAVRPNALALVLACAVAAGLAISRDREWRSLVAPVLAPAGFLAYMGFAWWRTGIATAWFRAEHEGWGQGFDFGRNLVHRAREFVAHPFDSPNEAVALLGVPLVLFLVYLLIRWRPPAPILAYTLAIVVLSLGSATVAGRPRFILIAFPLFIALARVVRGRTYTATVGVFAMGMATMILMTSLSTALEP